MNKISEVNDVLEVVAVSDAACVQRSQDKQSESQEVPTQAGEACPFCGEQCGHISLLVDELPTPQSFCMKLMSGTAAHALKLGLGLPREGAVLRMASAMDVARFDDFIGGLMEQIRDAAYAEGFALRHKWKKRRK